MKITSKEFWNTPIVDMMGEKSKLTVVLVSLLVVLGCIFLAGMAAAKMLNI